MHMATNNIRAFSAVTAGCRWLALIALVLLAGSASAANSNLTWGIDVTLKESYDDNVYLQDVAPLPANVAAAAAAGLTVV